ncbi:MAG: YHS domain-containing protein [Phycisphaerae bacterium]|nr:YHS domain-containing protein [Phycisphaerae bacterium]
MEKRKGQLIVALMLIALLSTAAFWLGGCKKKTDSAAQQSTQEQMVSQTMGAIEQTTCPVMEGNKINKDIFVEYKGKKVYFCCPACKEKFQQEPEKYILKLPQFSK